MGIQINGTTDDISANDGSWTATGLTDLRISTIKTPSGLGTVSFYNEGQIFTGITTFNGNVSGALSSGTAQSASGLGTAVNFTDIPSWVKRITIMFAGLSLSGGGNLSPMCVQLGDSGGIEQTGYLGVDSGGNSHTVGFRLTPGVTANDSISSNAFLTNLSGNTWVFSYCASGVGNLYASSGIKTTSDTLTQLRITTIEGTAPFDGGTINILYE